MPHAGFVHLRVRSAFSLLSSTVRHGDLPKACRAQAMPAVAVTDDANLFGAMQFCAAAKKAGVQPIVGALMPVAPPEAATRLAGRPPEPEHVVLLVKDGTGYANLLHLMCEAWVAAEAERAGQVTPELLARHNEGLILLTGGPCGPVGAALRRGDKEGAERLLLDLRAGLRRPALCRADAPRQRAGGARRARPDRSRLPPRRAAGRDQRRPLPLRRHARGARRAGLHRGRARRSRRRIAGASRSSTASRPPAEMADLFADLPEAVDNTLVIARRCAFMAPSREPILPTFAADEEAEMRAQAEAGLERRLRGGLARGHGRRRARGRRRALPRAARLRARRHRADGVLGLLPDRLRTSSTGRRTTASRSVRAAARAPARSSPGRSRSPTSIRSATTCCSSASSTPSACRCRTSTSTSARTRRDEVIDYVARELRRGPRRADHHLRHARRRAPCCATSAACWACRSARSTASASSCRTTRRNPVTLAQALEIEPRLKEAARRATRGRELIDIALKLEGLHAPRRHARRRRRDRRPAAWELVPLYRDRGRRCSSRSST